MTMVATNSYIFTLILRDPQTGYVWWFAEKGLQKDSYAPGFSVLWQNKWRERFWIVPKVGIVQVGNHDLEIYDMRSASLGDAQRELLAGLAEGKQSGVWPASQHQTNVTLIKALGEEFFYLPGSARPIDPPGIMGLGFTNRVLSIKLKSTVAKTNTVADVDLDSDFKIIKASRSDN
jgi:hypothetical protein